MRRAQFGFAAMMLLLPKTGVAENSAITSAYNQIRTHRYCVSVNDEDIRAAGYHCSLMAEIKKLAMGAADTFNALVFEQAGRDQIDKNTCLIGRMSALKGNQNVFGEWYSQLVLSWLGLKKSELLLNQCGIYNLSQRWHEAETARLKKEHKGDMKEVEIDLQSDKQHHRGVMEVQQSPAWSQICKDQKQMSALRMAHDLFLNTMPVISSPEFFKAMERHRGDIINGKTGHSITDNEILATDLSADLSFVKAKLSSGNKSDYIRIFDQLSEERKAINEKINRAQGSGNDLPDAVKEFIFSDGTLYQALRDRDLISDKFINFNKSGRDPNVTSRGAACLLAEFEPSIAGDILDFFGTSMVIGEMSLLFKGEEYLKEASTVSKLTDGFKAGAAVYGYSLIADTIFKSCLSPTSRSNTLTSAQPNDAATAVAARDLPKSVGFQMASLDNQLNQVKSCKADADKNLILNSFKKSLCLKNSLMMVMPLKYSLPALVFLNE